MEKTLEIINKYEAFASSSKGILIITFLVLVIIGLAVLFGMLRGWIYSIYLISYQAVSFTISLLLLPFMEKIAFKIAEKKFGDIQNTYVGYIEYFRPLVYGILFAILMILFTIIFELIYIIALRWIFLKPLKNRKKNEKSTWPIRLIGGGIGALVAFPVTLPYVNVAGLACAKENNYLKFNNGLISSLSNKKIQGASQYVWPLLGAGKLAFDDSAVKSIRDSFSKFTNMDNFSLGISLDLDGGGNDIFWNPTENWKNTNWDPSKDNLLVLWDGVGGNVNFNDPEELKRAKEVAKQKMLDFFANTNNAFNHIWDPNNTGNFDNIWDTDHDGVLDDKWKPKNNQIGTEFLENLEHVLKNEEFLKKIKVEATFSPWNIKGEVNESNPDVIKNQEISKGLISFEQLFSKYFNNDKSFQLLEIIMDQYDFAQQSTLKDNLKFVSKYINFLKKDSGNPESKGNGIIDLDFTALYLLIITNNVKNIKFGDFKLNINQKYATKIKNIFSKKLLGDIPTIYSLDEEQKLIKVQGVIQDNRSSEYKEKINNSSNDEKAKYLIEILINHILGIKSILN